MKQEIDNLTTDLFGRGRGRPASGTSLSGAERVRKYNQSKLDSNLKRFSVYLDVGLKAQLNEYCKKNNIKNDEFIADLIKKQLKLS